MSTNDLKLVWEALKFSEPITAHYQEPRQRHQQAIAIVERELELQTASTEADIQAALDFGKTAEQHLRGGQS